MLAVSNKTSESHETSLARHLPDDLSSSEAVRALIDDPMSTAMAVITAALASGRKEFVLAGGRIVQAVALGRGRAGGVWNGYQSSIYSSAFLVRRALSFPLVH